MMLVVAFSPGIPAFTQPEDSRQALAEGVAEEVAAPPSVAPGAWSSLQKLSDLYASGAPSNDLTEVGLLFHGFDGTEKGWPTDDMWHPCAEGWCQGATDHWSASIVSHQHKAVFSDTGILYAPNLNTVMCSDFTDFGSLINGCSSTVSDGWEGSTFPEDKLKDMLERSVTDPALEFAYNEVLIDSQQFVKNLPGSVGAFVFGMTGKPTQGDQMQATAAYVNFLDAYNLTETDVPLLQLHHTGPQAFSDESAGARKYVEEHPHAYQTWLKTLVAEHPAMSGVPLDEIPEHLPGVLRGEAEALAKTKTARVAKKEAPALAPKGHKAEKKAPRTDEEKVAMAEEKAAKAEEKAAKAQEKAAKAAAAVDEEKAAKAAKKADEEKTAKKAHPSTPKPDSGGEPAWWRTDCKAIAGTQVRDAWCAKNCGSSIPFCPTDQCECEGGNPIAYTDNMTAPSQGAKVILQCKAVDDDRNIDVNDAWCMLSCNPKAGAPPNCPTKACKCEGGNPTAGGMPAHLTPEAVEQWKENEEKKKHAQAEADKRKQADILAAQEAKKVAARDAAMAAAAKRDADREEERERVEAERQAAAAAAAQANRQTPVPVRDERLPTATHAPPNRELTDAEEKAQKEIEDSQKAIEAAHRAAQQAQQADEPSLSEPVNPAPPRELTDDEIEAQRIRDEAQKEREEGQKAIDAAHKATQQAAEEIRQQTAADAEKKETDRIQAEKDRLADSEQEAKEAEEAEEAEEPEEAEEAEEGAAERLVKDEAAHSRGHGHKWHKPKSAQPEAHHRGDGHKWHEAKPEDE